MKIIFITTKSITFNTFLKSQADYFIKKGADDSIANAEGLTCYEGLSQESVNNI